MAELPPSDHESPAGAPAEQEAVNRRGRRMAAAAIAVLTVVGGLIGFVIIPAG